MSNVTYKLGFCRFCHINVQHFRGKKPVKSRALDLLSLYVLNFGPWYCAQCENRSRCLPRIRKSEPTKKRIDEGTERVGNFIRSDGSLVLRKKRSGRYSAKFRQGVVHRLLNGKTTIGQLTIELEITEYDLLSWVAEVLESRDQRIQELTSLLKSYHRAAANLIGITDNTADYDEEENMIEGNYEYRSDSSPTVD